MAKTDLFEEQKKLTKPPIPLAGFYEKCGYVQRYESEAGLFGK